MRFEFTPHADFNFVTSFAEKFNVPVCDNKLSIPASLGKGYIQFIALEPGLRVIIHRYILKEEFVLRRKASANVLDMISIIFYTDDELVNFSTRDEQQIQFSKNTNSAIQITSGNLDSVNCFPANINIHYIVVAIRTSTLIMLLSKEKPSSIIQAITCGNLNFLFSESMSQDIEKVIKHLADVSQENELSAFYCRIKVLELLYLLFGKLLQRESGMHSPVNKSDIEKLFIVKNTVLTDLSKPPRLHELSKISGLSQTKMKDLFKQVFGNSIYNYYQKARMEEAAFLLKQVKHSVSETGYHLGFSNLSHFSRVFQPGISNHRGENSKKYALGR